MVVIAARSRLRTVTDKDQETRWGKRIATRYLGADAPGSSRLSGPGQTASGSPTILGVKADHGESELKVQEVLVKVYEPGRLQMAWQQVRENAGAARIDQMVFLHDFTVAFLSGLMGSATDRGAVYLAGTCRSVGRG